MLLLLTLFLSSFLPCGLARQTKVDHVVVLMLENRAFDHFFGYRPDVNGVVGKDLFNLVDPTEPHSPKIRPSENARYVAPCNPHHGTPATTEKIFTLHGNHSHPTMGGFVATERRMGNAATNFCAVMDSFAPAKIPVISFLAKEYALFDAMFASHPGPTWVNRQFAMSATSLGNTGTGSWFLNQTGRLFPQTTIFDQMEEQGRTWRNVYVDTVWEIFMKKIAMSPNNLQQIESFYEDCKTGDLASFTWINPSSGVDRATGWGSSDQHPTHDVAVGEALIKKVYEEIRASPAWNRTLFIVTYDEHGGFWDHVPPPQPVASPGNLPNFTYPDAGFKWDRLGVRVPFIAISPLIPRNTVESSPNESYYDHTSTLSTSRILLGMKNTYLTNRDRQSATFDHVLSLSTPRTNCPMKTPDAPAPSLSLHDTLHQEHSDLQADILEAIAHMAGAPPHSPLSRSAVDASEMSRSHFGAFLEMRKTIGSVVTAPCELSKDRVLTRSFWVNSSVSAPFDIISSRDFPSLCIEYDLRRNSITLNRCSAENPDQQWVWLPDYTIRPWEDQSKCLASEEPQSHQVALQTCAEDNPHHHWGVHGPAAGAERGGQGIGSILYGDGGYCLTVLKN